MEYVYVYVGRACLRVSWAIRILFAQVLQECKLVRLQQGYPFILLISETLVTQVSHYVMAYGIRTYVLSQQGFIQGLSVRWA